MRRSKCKWVTTSAEGFVRYLVANILPHGYRYYLTGHVKPGRDLDEFDRTLNAKFRFAASRSWRNRRKQARGPDGERLGLANVRYLRFERFWILIATKGYHRFYEEHARRSKDGEIVETFFRDVHRDPIFFEGYSIRISEGGYSSKRLWKNPAVPELDPRNRVRVRVANDTFRELAGDFIERAKSGRWGADVLEAAIWNLPFLPYAPVREQLRDLVRWMNEARRERGFKDLLDRSRCIRRTIPAIKAFESHPLNAAA